RGKRAGGTVWPSRRKVLLVVGAGLVEGRAENVAERGARVGRTVLGDGFFLFRDFQRLDRELDLAGGAIELRHARIDLVADGKAFGTLVAAVAGEFRTTDESGHVVVAH